MPATYKEREALRALLAVNPVETTLRQHLTDARIIVRCVFCAATAESLHSHWFPARSTLLHALGCPWLVAVRDFPELYRPRCHYCPGSPTGKVGQPCPHCQRPVSPGKFREPPPGL